MPLCAAICRSLPGQECNPASLLATLPLCQREGRRFESGLVLHTQDELVARSVAGSFCVQILMLVFV